MRDHSPTSIRRHREVPRLASGERDLSGERRRDMRHRRTHDRLVGIGVFLTLTVVLVAALAASQPGVSCSGEQTVYVSSGDTFDGLIAREVQGAGSTVALDHVRNLVLQETAASTRIHPGDALTLPQSCSDSVLSGWTRK